MLWEIYNEFYSKHWYEVDLIGKEVILRTISEMFNQGLTKYQMLQELEDRFAIQYNGGYKHGYNKHY